MAAFIFIYLFFLTPDLFQMPHEVMSQTCDFTPSQLTNNVMKLK